MNLVFIKLGGSVITDKSKPFTVRAETLKRLTREIHILKRKNPDKRFLVGHGSGSFAHQPAKKYETHKGFIDGERSKKGAALVQDAAAKLNRIVVQHLIDSGENAVSFQPSAMMRVLKNGNVEAHLGTLEYFLDQNFLPVPYGDVIADENNGVRIMSTEDVFDVFINTWQNNGRYLIKKIILVSETDGVRRNFGKGERFERITSKNFEEVKKELTGSSEVDVTGGMLHKVKMSLKWADNGIKTYIVGMKEGEIEKALIDSEIEGTVTS